ncbi:MAG: hypothetical protein IT318_05315 [Anaerolineales bacterium]|nr:hypothetical protein [Anaerolineales bacterium]
MRRRSARARGGKAAAAGQALVGEPFDVTALYMVRAEAAALALTFTLPLQYSANDLGGAPEDTPALRRWEGQ